MKEYKIETFEEFITAIDSLTTDFDNGLLWWRGQADSKWKLRPGVFRSGYKNFEQNLIFDFMMKAKSRFPNCPTNDDPPPWLLLMQHYGLPTRILDWTESPLIALYFAVNNEKKDIKDKKVEKDAVIYALQPFYLNSKQCDMNLIPSPGYPKIGTIFTDSFDQDIPNPDGRIAAVQTEQFDLRHLVQQSEFTVHGSATAIEDLPQNEEFLGKIIISGPAKIELRRMLQVFGITRSYLFPDLDNLSTELASLYRVE